jgi:hypothetical protein
MSADITASRTSQRWSLRKRLLIAVLILLPPVLFGLWLYLIATGVGQVPDVSGDLTLEAPSGTRFFVGGAQGNDYRTAAKRGSAGPSVFVLDFQDLFGLEENAALAKHAVAVPLPADLPRPTAVDVAGEGAQLLKSSQGNSSGSAMWVACTCEDYWVRRAGGELDHVLVLLLDWNLPGEPRQRFFLPVRLRGPTNAAAVCLEPGGCSFGGGQTPRFFKLFAQSPTQMHVRWHFQKGKPPAELAQEVAEKGLWEPGR